MDVKQGGGASTSGPRRRVVEPRPEKDGFGRWALDITISLAPSLPPPLLCPAGRNFRKALGLLQTALEAEGQLRSLSLGVGRWALGRVGPRLEYFWSPVLQNTPLTVQRLGVGRWRDRDVPGGEGERVDAH